MTNRPDSLGAPVTPREVPAIRRADGLLPHGPMPRSLRSASLEFSVSAMLAIVAVFPLPYTAHAAEPSTIDVVPLPAEIHPQTGRLAVTAAFSVALTGSTDSPLRDALSRALHRVEARTGLVFAREASGAFSISAGDARASLVVYCASSSPALPALEDDESYTLEIDPSQARLRATTTTGVLHGLETLLQLLQSDAGSWFLPALEIKDRPRFPWRGLMLDVCRHWQPIDVVKRNLDGMALAKLNVLHFHLSEDQGFRVESKKFPRLQEFGSDGNFYTQDQLREIVAYAAARGIRVVPEFDMPGHAQSWVVGYPALASAPGPYVIQRAWGVFDPVLDPTNEATYALLEGFLGEMAAIFPDPYFHIGGDENNGVQWSANPRIQAFIKEHNLHDNGGLHAYFNRRVQSILAAHGKKLVGWDEILHPDLPKTAVIQSWRGADGLAAAVRAGHAVILSNGYYIDLIEPAARHYVNDPLPADTPLSATEQARVLGGEATMWSEWVSPETIDSRIWPRTAAIAERLWSPRAVNDVTDMYRRLAFVSHRLTEAGLLHEAYREPMLRRYAGDRATPEAFAALRDLVALCEPVKGYRRTQVTPHASQYTPLTGLADCVAPDSVEGREFSWAVDAVSLGGAAPATLASHFAEWRALATRVIATAPTTGPRAAELTALAGQLADAAACGEEIVSRLNVAPADTSAAWFESMLARLDRVGMPQAATELPVVAPLKFLASAVRETGHRGTLSPDAWREHLREIAFPPKKS